jgi:hypothetical protein
MRRLHTQRADHLPAELHQQIKGTCPDAGGRTPLMSPMIALVTPRRKWWLLASPAEVPRRHASPKGVHMSNQAAFLQQ